MTPIRFSPSSLKEGRWYEYLIRFGLGGAATVFTGLVGSRYGASVGGLFLALPAIFCASATFIGASLAWLMVSVAAWFLRRQMRWSRQARISRKRTAAPRPREAAKIDVGVRPRSKPSR